MILTNLIRLSAPLPLDWLRRWYVIGACAALSFIGMASMSVSAQFALAMGTFAKLAGAFVVAGLLLRALHVPRFAEVLKATSAFFLTLGQHVAFITAAFALPYIAAALNMPLQDAAFREFDIWIGFDWSASAQWTAAHSWVQTLLWTAYGSMFLQTVVLLFVYRERGEFAWMFMALLLASILVSAFVPALGNPGMIGQSHIDTLQAARAGQISAVSGIITFPSFHAALGVLFVYASRISRSLYRVALPLNLLLIVSTPVCGGHYLADTLAGVALALGVILIVSVRRIPLAVRFR